MTQEEKDLLLKDLCARLLYGVKVNYYGTILMLDRGLPSDDELENGVKPYLRPMSSMTEEEKEELYEVSGLICYDGLFTCKKLAKKQSFIADTTDWLNAHHFDYRGLIEKGIALEAPEDMYKK